MIGAQSGVAQDLPGDQAYIGSPPLPHREFLRVVNIIPKLPEMRKTLIEIEKRLKKIEEMLFSGGKEK
jgi:UDP-3-O-[3-hydroxymyristoyl] glucosamine N-acyltransferase